MGERHQHHPVEAVTPMARIRQLKPEFWTDDKIAGLSRDARLLFLGLLTEADDDGRLVDSPKLLAGSLFPFDNDVTPKKLAVWLGEITRRGLVRRYVRGAASYLYIVNFKRHQKIAHPRRSSLPPPEDNPHDVGNLPEERAQDTRIPHEERAQNADELPSKRAPDLGVKGSRGQGVKGVGVENSSSSNLDRVEQLGGESEEEEFRSTKTQAVALIAERQLGIRLAKTDLDPVGDRVGWLKSARAKAWVDHGEELHSLAAQGLHPKAMADRIMPPMASPYPAYEEASNDEPVTDPDERARRLVDLRISHGAS